MAQIYNKNVNRVKRIKRYRAIALKLLIIFEKNNSTFKNGTMYFCQWHYYRFWDEFSDLQHEVILVTQSMKIVKNNFHLFLFLTMPMIIHIDRVLLTSEESKHFLLTYQLVTHYLLMWFGKRKWMIFKNILICWWCWGNVVNITETPKICMWLV